MFFNLSLLLAFVLPLCVFAAPIGSILKRQELVVRDQEADQGHNLTKRFDDTRWTFYNVETGNQVFCGGFHNNNDAIVALSGANMNQGLCGKTISMTFQGVTRTATIVDMCPGCPPFGLDLAQNFFTQFASSDMGVISGQWNFVDGGSPAPPPPPPPPPSPTPAPAPPPAPPAPDATPSPSPPDAPPASPTPSAAAPPPPEAPPASPTPSGAVPPPPEVPPPAPTTTPSDPSPSPAAAEPSSPPEPCEPDTPDAPADPASVSSPPNDPQPIPSPESPTPSPPPVSSSSSDLYPSSVSPAPEIPATTSTPTPTPIPTSSASSTDSASSSTSSDVSPTAVALGSIKTSGARSFLAGPKELTALVGALLVVFCCL